MIFMIFQDVYKRQVQRGRERPVFLFQHFIFDGGLGEGYVVLSQLVLHPCHVGDIAVQHLADLRLSLIHIFQDRTGVQRYVQAAVSGAQAAPDRL